MRHPSRSCAPRPLVAAAALACSTLAAAAPTGRILQAGLCAPGSTKEVYKQPDSAAGYASRGNVMITSPTDEVPLRKGAGFGYLWHASGLPPTFDLVYRIQHPPITRPDGKRLEAFTETLTLPSVEGELDTADCYFLDEDYELVPGDWTIALLVDDKVLVTKTFHVVRETR